jgi:hypothetical protein
MGIFISAADCEVPKSFLSLHKKDSREKVKLVGVAGSLGRKGAKFGLRTTEAGM